MNIFDCERPVLPDVFPSRVLPVPKCIRFQPLSGYNEEMNSSQGVKQCAQQEEDIQHFLFAGMNEFKSQHLNSPKLDFSLNGSYKMRKISSENSQPTADKEDTEQIPKKEKKEVKGVKGVKEEIFRQKITELYTFLDTITDDKYNFIVKIKANYFKRNRKTKRRSGYRGVSRNGASWQVLMMVNKVKTYIGSYDTEEEGALVYDIISILFKQNKARTNLSYSKSKLLNLLSCYDQDSKHFVCPIPEVYLRELKLSIGQ
ncbi:unnamed protein product [Moneuplotes crassus]|uniref:AP2/ERF domain-containing protein n=1 Tax=Euplotes crassus TaxID=5936 RepID=A0AAD1UK67_EUPCR|nr:unnamed protein product [Moneuplotes crassus]